MIWDPAKEFVLSRAGLIYLGPTHEALPHQEALLEAVPGLRPPDRPDLFRGPPRGQVDPLELRGGPRPAGVLLLAPDLGFRPPCEEQGPDGHRALRVRQEPALYRHLLRDDRHRVPDDGRPPETGPALVLHVHELAHPGLRHPRLQIGRAHV